MTNDSHYQPQEQINKSRHVGRMRYTGRLTKISSTRLRNPQTAAVVSGEIVLHADVFGVN